MSAVRRVARRFTKLGVEVLSPSSFSVKREVRGFVILRGDTGTPREVEREHLAAIRNSDFLYIVNPDREIGVSTCLEIGFAVAHDIPVFCLRAPAEYVLRLFTRNAPTPAVVVKILRRQVLPPIPTGASLTELQSFLRQMVRVRGFENESVRDKLLLMLEEFGELAKGFRLQAGLKVHVTKRGLRSKVAEELVDCLIYLLDIANMLGIQMAGALRAKEAVNKRRKWISYKSLR